MPTTHVKCTHNSSPIRAEANNVTGGTVSFTIQPNQALIDKNGTVRFFTVEYEDGDVQSYLLAPYILKTKRVDERILGAIEFLGELGLKVVSGRVVKDAKARNPELSFFIDAGKIIFNQAGGYAIKSFKDDLDYLFNKEEYHLGYCNILTNKLIWTDPLMLN